MHFRSPDTSLTVNNRLALALQHQVIPRAISFFDGSINRQDPEFGDSDEFDDEDLSDDDEEDSDDEGGRRGGVRKAPAPPSGGTPASAQDPQECKQQ